SIKAINLSQRQANFIDSVTHELKSPIASLKLYLQTLNRLKVSPEKAVDFYSTMLDDVERLDNLINHLLDAGRLDRDREDLEVVDIRVDQVLSSTAQAVATLYRVPSESFELDLQPCILRCARGDLEIVFRNLMDNAIKYSGNDGKVQVCSKIKADGTITVEVADNGPGIPKSKRVIIFSRFSRLGMELQREKPGTGLGLYIVRTLVRRMRGNIQVRDAQSGSGTIFVVTLPGGRRIPPGESALEGSPVATNILG
ncbi:MAG: HAMP domain-containing sensor histidine kinase, partial [Pirellulaceae bacterium]